MDNPSSSPRFSPELNLHNLKAIRILGKGAMGTVFLVHDTSIDPTARSPFALKVVPRSKHDTDRRGHLEIGILRRLSSSDPNVHHPFLPRLLGHLQTTEFLAWAIPYCPGNDLHVLRYCQDGRVFSPVVIRFYVAEILCALERLHSLGVVYRDLKPENILIQQSGHVLLTDFDLSRNLKKKNSSTEEKKDRNFSERRNIFQCVPIAPDGKFEKVLNKAKSARVNPISRRKMSSFSDEGRSNSFVGTEEYVSPEVLRGHGHEFAVDWWALGILIYEMLHGTTPFKGVNRKETFRKILTKDPKFMGVHDHNALKDLIQRLLQKDPKKRLGYDRGACEIKEHAFFNGIKWDFLTEVLRPPFIPSRDKDDSITGEIDIKEYFHKSKAPSSTLTAPTLALSSQHRRIVSFTEF